MLSGAVVVAPIAAVAVGLLWWVWRYTGEADESDSFYDALREAGFALEEDPEGAWTRSQGLPMPVDRRYYDPDRDFNVIWRKYYRSNARSPATLARREDRWARVAVYLCPSFFAEGRDGVMVAVDPKDRTILATPSADVLREVERESGWGVRVQGMWLVLQRTQPVETRPEDASRVVEDALSIARRLLGGAVR